MKKHLSQIREIKDYCNYQGFYPLYFEAFDINKAKEVGSLFKASFEGKLSLIKLTQFKPKE